MLKSSDGLRRPASGWYITRMSDRVGDLSKDELKEIVKEAVGETLVQMGVDTSSPLEMQRDFQHLRDWRMAQEVVRRKGYAVMIGVLVTGGISLLWLGAKNFLFDLVK